MEHTTAECASSGSTNRTHQDSGTSLTAGAPELDALFRAHYRRICRVIYRIVGQPDLAESLAAEAFWKLHERRPAHLTNAEAWLCRTGVRLALDSLRKDMDEEGKLQRTTLVWNTPDRLYALSSYLSDDELIAIANAVPQP